MKKYMVWCAGLCLTMAFTGCKSSESAYKKAYEKAKAQETASQAPVVTEQPTETAVVAPVEQKPVTELKIVDNTDNVKVTQEKVSLVNGSGLKNFSVVVGSFQLKANAEGLVQRLRDAGYDAQLVLNVERNMYRVVATTFETKAEAVASKNELVGKYQGAWLLYNTAQ